MHECVTGDALMDWVARPLDQCELENCIGHGGCDKRWDPVDDPTNPVVECGHALTVYGPVDPTTGNRHLICKGVF